MNPSIFFSLSRLLRLIAVSWLVGCLVIPSVRAQTTTSYPLPLKVSKNGRSAAVSVPEAISGQVVIESYSARLGWQRFTTVQAVPGKMLFNFPRGKAIKWRAMMQFKSNFPAKFFAGKSQFGPVKSNSGPPNYAVFREYSAAWNSTMGMMDSAAALSGASAAPVPVESDIWKIDGTTVFYFNQLRGLQVLDLADPADPRLTASLRLPAAGQDLYLLPPSGNSKNLILLTTSNNSEGVTVTRINQIQVTGRTAVITHIQELQGNLADSRLVGARLILATTRQSPENPQWFLESHLTEWILTPGQAPAAAGETGIQGINPLIAAGPDWLAVATTATGRYWNVSDVTVFALKTTGLVRLTQEPIRTAGLIADRFKMQWVDNVLTTISERNNENGIWRPTTVLENFRVWGPDVRPATADAAPNPLLGQLELARGERLYAARFSGKLAYIVTFLRTDPLWVVDLADAANPVIAGHLEVPGWSSHLVPLGDLLFSIGWESGTIAASLFDVADPANPTLIRRLNLGNNSEAVWDDKALKVLAEDGLALIPMTRYDANSGQKIAGVQLLDLDLSGRDLRTRGFIPHAFDARRAGLSGETVVSISQRGLVTADIADRDAPAVLAEVALAWPVDRVLDAGPYLVQIEAGTGYGESSATARISPANATEEVLAEIDLDKGTIVCAEIRDGRLYVLRDNSRLNYWRYWGPVDDTADNTLYFDIYDASALPALPLLGSCSRATSGRQNVSGGKFLWPQANRPSVVLEGQSWPIYYWGGGFPIALENAVIPAVSLQRTASGSAVGSIASPDSIMLPRWPSWGSDSAPNLLVFDSSNPSTPTLAATLDIGAKGTRSSGACAAADGLLVIGTSQWTAVENSYTGESSHAVHVFSFPAVGLPSLRKTIDLPGSLFEITSLDRQGFLAFTQAATAGGFEVQISACDGYDAYQVNQLALGEYSAIAACGRRILVASENGIERHRLTDLGALIAEPTLVTGWRPLLLRSSDGLVIASTWNRLYAADLSGAASAQWQFPGWSLQADKVTVASDGDLLVPFGEYGADRLQR